MFWKRQAEKNTHTQNVCTTHTYSVWGESHADTLIWDYHRNLICIAAHPLALLRTEQGIVPQKAITYKELLWICYSKEPRRRWPVTLDLLTPAASSYLHLCPQTMALILGAVQRDWGWQVLARQLLLRGRAWWSFWLLGLPASLRGKQGVQKKLKWSSYQNWLGTSLQQQCKKHFCGSLATSQ